MYFTGSSDLITLKGNYIYRTSGRAPKVQGNTLLHAVSFDTFHLHYCISVSSTIYVYTRLFGKEKKEMISLTRWFLQVNNYWYSNSGHAFEIGSGGNVLAEGNVFQNILTVAESPISGQLFTSPDTNTNAVCSTHLGRVCQTNGFGSSGSFKQADTAFLINFSGKNVAPATAYTSVVASVNANAGQGKL